jgi:tetratricopeptide (TPR) repeat protein
MLGQPDQANHRDESLEIFERLGELLRVSDVMNNEGGFAYFAGDWDEAVSWYRRSQDASRRAGNTVQAALAGGNIAEVLIGQGRYDEASPELQEARRVLRAADARAFLPFVELQIARLDTETGHLRRSIAELDRLRSALNDAGDRLESLEAAIHLGDALLKAGDPSRAMDVVDAAEARAGDEGGFFAAAIAWVRSRALWEIGDSETANGIAGKGIAAAVEGGLPYDEYLLRTWRIQMASAVEALPDAVDIARRIELRDGLGIVFESVVPESASN